MLTSRTTKLSISSPHRTTDAYDGSSSILWYPSVLSVQIAPCSILARFARNRAVSLTCTTFAPIVAVSGSGLDRIPEEGNVRNRSNCLRPPRLRSDCHPCVLAETRVPRKRILHSDNGDSTSRAHSPKPTVPVCPAALNEEFPSETNPLDPMEACAQYPDERRWNWFSRQKLAERSTGNCHTSRLHVRGLYKRSQCVFWQWK
jgi:hypothetical protein